MRGGGVLEAETGFPAPVFATSLPPDIQFRALLLEGWTISVFDPCDQLRSLCQRISKGTVCSGGRPLGVGRTTRAAKDSCFHNFLDWTGERKEFRMLHGANLCTSGQRKPNCFPRCRRAHTAARVFWLHGTCAAESTGRPPLLTAGRLAPACFTVGCLARRAGAQKQLTRVRPSKPSCSATHRHCHRSLQQDVHALRVGSTIRPSCMHQKKGSCSRIVHCIRFNVATARPKGPLTAAEGRA